MYDLSQDTETVRAHRVYSQSDLNIPDWSNFDDGHFVRRGYNVLLCREVVRAKLHRGTPIEFFRTAHPSSDFAGRDGAHRCQRKGPKAILFPLGVVGIQSED